MSTPRFQLGDIVAAIIAKVFRVKAQSCSSCGRRKRRLNRFGAYLVGIVVAVFPCLKHGRKKKTRTKPRPTPEQLKQKKELFRQKLREAAQKSTVARDDRPP